MPSPKSNNLYAIKLKLLIIYKTKNEMRVEWIYIVVIDITTK